MLCDVEDRIGSNAGPNGSTEIKNHPFFYGVDWDKLRTIQAPFMPNLKSNVDVSYFPVNDIPQEDTTAQHRAQVDALGDEHAAEMSLPFIGYTFKRYQAFDGGR